MNFIDTLLTADLVIKSGAVPLLIGESGIGKTALAKTLAEKEAYYLVTIDGNMLKEGEIGGLPTVEDYTVNMGGKEVIKKRTVYAVHTKLQEIDDIISKNPDEEVLLFIDEINRCEHSVQQELMNIILNREINGYRLHQNVKVIAAMNPSSKYDDFAGTDYGVIDMDRAQEDRFVWIELEADTKSWLQWGMERNHIKGEKNIHEHVLEFIANFPEFLHTPNSQEMIKATPRSWERVSNSYKVYLKSQNKIPSRIFYNVVRGNVGGSIAQDFINFIENNKNPLIRPEDLFRNDELTDDLREKVKDESHSRLYLSAKNALIYLAEEKHSEFEIRLFTDFLQLYPTDLRMAIMQEIKWNYEDNLYKEFLNEEVFIESYFSMYEKL